jgi:hypothetical protein
MRLEFEKFELVQRSMQLPALARVTVQGGDFGFLQILCPSRTGMRAPARIQM